MHRGTFFYAVVFVDLYKFLDQGTNQTLNISPFVGLCQLHSDEMEASLCGNWLPLPWWWRSIITQREFHLRTATGRTPSSTLNSSKQCTVPALFPELWSLHLWDGAGFSVAWFLPSDEGRPCGSRTEERKEMTAWWNVNAGSQWSS